MRIRINSLLSVLSYCFTLGGMLLIMYDKHLRHVVSESYKWKNILSIIWVHLFKSNTTWETANLKLIRSKIYEFHRYSE